MTDESDEPGYVPDHGHVIVTRHAVVRHPQLSEWSDPNPTTGKPHAPVVAKLSRPSPSVRLFFIEHGSDGWIKAYWVTTSLLRPFDPGDGAEVDYDSEEEMT